MNKLIKTAIVLLVFISKIDAIAQSSTEKEVLNISKQIFNWEVEKKFDSLENIFHEKFAVVGSSGESQNKEKYIARLRSENFIHNSIDIEEDTAMVVNNTATVVGRGKFAVTVSGNKVMLHLSYIEVFTRPDAKERWRVLAMHASILQN